MMTISLTQASACPRLMQREHGTDLSHFTLREAHDKQLRGARCVVRRDIPVLPMTEFSKIEQLAGMDT